MILAELDIRHTRTHMPTRRVALAGMHLPTASAADGLILVDAIVRTFLPVLDDERRAAFDQVVATAKAGTLIVPGIIMRYRLQLDLHGLDRSRHRIIDEVVPGYEEFPEDERPHHRVIELDTHGPADPQLLGVILAADALPPTARQLVLRTIEDAVRATYRPPHGYRTRFLAEGVPRSAPSAPGTNYAGADEGIATWAGVRSDERWAMEVLGLRPDLGFDRDEVQRRFRRLLRLAHPDQGAERDGAAERISELAEAREILLSHPGPAADDTAAGPA